MTTRKWMLAIAVVLAVVAIFTLAPVTWAQTYGPGNGPGNGQMGGRRGGGNGYGQMGPQSSLIAVAAEKLGFSQADLVAELQSGKTVAQVAEAKGVALATIVDAFAAPRAERIAAQVQAGNLTQADADARLATMKSMVTARLSAAWSPQGPGFVDANGDGVCDTAGQGGGRQNGRMGGPRMGLGR